MFNVLYSEFIQENQVETGFVSVLIRNVGLRARLTTFVDTDISSKVGNESNKNGCFLIVTSTSSTATPEIAAKNKKTIETLKKKFFEIAGSI